VDRVSPQNNFLLPSPAFLKNQTKEDSCSEHVKPWYQFCKTSVYLCAMHVFLCSLGCNDYPIH